VNQHSDYYPQTGGPATSLPIPPDIAPERTLSATEWGVLSFLLSEVAFFATLIVAYIAFKGRDIAPPTPEVLSLPLALGTTACLIASSFTIHLATHSLVQGASALFRWWWTLSIALGIAFLAGTAFEWYGLIVHEGLTISRNLFGTTFYTLVGFHGLHVTGGIVAMLLVLLTLGRKASPQHATAPRMVSWYWHFVDMVWIVVFAVVYL
jgi:cytochrome c oxidase subunit 3/cytochrome o ubiquinol oxidase subunit 3